MKSQSIKTAAKKLWHYTGIALVISLLLMTPAAIAQDGEIDPIVDAQQSTVFLMQTYDVAGTQTLSCVGSGTIISPTGLILTNAHLADALGPCRGERIIVALSVRLDEPPVPTYLADIVQIDTRLDAAVLQISGSLDGSPIDPESLNLPSVSIGDPSNLLPGNALTFVGYPDVSATNVTAISGVITGVTTETSGSRFAWFRTELDLGGGMSGGGAYDASGRLVALPTSAPATSGEEPGINCLSIQDNTNDGLITEQDACVPIGDNVTAMRPVSLITPLIEAANYGFKLDHREGLVTTAPPEQAVISRMFVSQQISDLGIPTRIVTNLPSGTTSAFVFFDYDNMRPGMAYELRVTRDGVDMPQFSLGPLAWGGGSNGTWYIGSENMTWPDGNYEFSILLEGQIAATTNITVGETVSEPVFSDLTVGTPDGAGGFTIQASLLPAETPQIDAIFAAENMPEGQDWTEIWYLDGTEISRNVYTWDQGPSGAARVSAINYEGLPLGSYRLELLIGERLAATADLTLAGNINSQGQSIAFSNPRMSSDISRDGLPEGNSGDVMPLGVTNLYAFVDWDFMPTGTIWTYRWILDGRIVASQTASWDAGGVGKDFWISLNMDESLPEGNYAVDVLVENQPMFSLGVSVGSGTQPPSGEEGASEEVFVSGQVVDAVTGEGISGALVIVLDVAFESAQFNWDESQIYTQSITDREGRFSLTKGLPRSNYYTVYVFAEDYITVLEDNFWVFRDSPQSPDITIEMSRP